ncbi:hypothetical protein CONPUDRAFT_154513 [Coniophora puteana RWD-64-598 SS2]|uniref:C2H2-type domain-containing protein n=1 Tax=Coniophora puteana (strain RWD-64-598) TaxID=741705 RepID=A0A5M3MMQ6_CONPW|nr:uncharacterized protein CONPUDRAFT_154513 [Coniophora puteana RWD-64-598 SS2]EIW80482.1 hypothetical protein CONPUDRAFT_154513 [Coniophora puteana RWD-64-598 SS2]
MPDPPEHDDIDAQQANSYSTVYTYGHTQLTPPSAGSHHQGHSRPYETLQHPIPTPQIDRELYSESSLRSTFGVERHGLPASIYMSEALSLHPNQPVLPFDRIDANNELVPEVLQPSIAEPSRNPDAPSHPAQSMMHSQIRRQPIQGQQLPPLMTAHHYNPAYSVQDNPEPSFHAMLSPDHLISTQQGAYPDAVAVVGHESKGLDRQGAWWRSTQPSALTTDAYAPAQLPQSVPQSGLESMPYWPASAASAPAWTGVPFAEDRTFPLEDPKQIPYRLSDAGWSEDEDEEDEGTGIPKETDLSAESKGNKGKGKGKRRERERKHKCPTCDKAFVRPSSLGLHMNTHTGSKPFGCMVPGCNKRFTIQSNATRHLQSHGMTPHSRSRSSRFAVSFDAPVVSHNVHSAVPQPSSYEWLQPQGSTSGLAPSASAPPSLEPPRPSWAPASDVAGPSRLPRRHTDGPPTERERAEMHLGTRQQRQAPTRRSGQGAGGHSLWRRKGQDMSSDEDDDQGESDEEE